MTSLRSLLGTGLSRRKLLLVGVVLSFVALGISLIDRVDGNGANIGNHLIFNGWVLAWLLVVTVLLRSLAVLDVARFWFLGYFVVSLVVVGLGWLTEQVLDADGTAQVAVAIPVIEETAKLLPVVLFALFLRQRLTRLTLTDVVIAGFAVGAGLGFREDLVRERLAADGFDGSFWGVLFPSTIHDDVRFIVTHGGWTAIAAFGVGLAVLHRRPWAYAVAVLAWLVAVADHAAVNSFDPVGEGLHALTADGRVAAYALVVVIVGAVAHDVVVLRQAGRADDRFASLLRAPTNTVDGWLTSLRYRHLLVGARLHAWKTNGSGDAVEPGELVDHGPIVRELTALESRLDA